MPDVAQDARPHVAGALDWVGMGEIHVPVSLSLADGRSVQSGARVTAYVNLAKPDVRGIHMSRLYLHVDRSLSTEPLTPCSLRRLLKDFLDSHAELSDRAMVRIAFDYLIRRPALVSDNSGWKSYPIVLTALMDRGQFSLELGCEVVYSSTCPCSAALARQLIQEKFGQDFARGQALDYDAVVAWLGSEQGIVATPHSQRSSAEVRARLAQGFDLPIIDVIDRVEAALKTPVQTAVKRVDEQAFARLNGQNLMFCEDAARRVQQALDTDERIVDFWVRTSHFESLHPHNAVAVATKGVTGGYTGGIDAFATVGA
ncbi:GTP cyclohydrolase FolE2 [Tahibacter amnicola]|uniref:GTP cyclohydrolase FolE2 n=2 Tax=Tahibacter amnicola TaxID=2976241 RepID=A0ABY6BLK7_9GAMM|nr:GTP cyclohydrolase FolE2 [Tahibacter amnicola]UXI70667.1 GTP cyclohydrolase FolE2 [Tahibacter amnicola]